MGPSKQPIPTSLNPGGGGAVTAVRLGFPEIGGSSSLQPRFSAPEPRSTHSDTGEDKRASPRQCGAEPRRTRPRHVLAQEAHHEQQGPGAPAHHAGESPSRTHNHGPARTPKRGRRPQTLHVRSTGWEHPKRRSGSGADTERSCARGWASARAGTWHPAERHPPSPTPALLDSPAQGEPVAHRDRSSSRGGESAPLLQPRGPTAKTGASPAGPLNLCPGWAQQGIAGSFLQGCPPRLRGRPQRRECGSPRRWRGSGPPHPT